MYRYNFADQQLVEDRVARFREQMQRFLSGKLSEDEFRPLRLQNGLYIQRHAPMLRVAIPYGVLSADQLDKLADIALRWDRGYGHFTTRCNMQFNWVRLEDAPDILAELASVEMHAIQTSGNCIRNITSDPLAGVAADEIFDPRPYCEIVRQWSTLAPEFQFLPRKFKIAISGGVEDRAIIRLHDIGIQATRDAAGTPGFRIFVGGGLGRTPMTGELLRDFLPREDLLDYLDAILRLYNRYGRRDNKYKARLKILVKDRTPQGFAAEVDEEWQQTRGSYPITPAQQATMEQFFAPPVRPAIAEQSLDEYQSQLSRHLEFARWVQRNVSAHKVPGLAVVTLTLKATGQPTGDATAQQMRAAASLARHYSADEIRVTHKQNLILPQVCEQDLFSVWDMARQHGLATPNADLLTDLVCCPGGDFCSLANARSIPVAAAIQERFDRLDYLHDLGPISLNISGCVNACGHHHIGHIGILGVDKNGEEWFQVTLGGRKGTQAQIGRVIGPAFAATDIPEVIDTLLTTYLQHRHAEEHFIDTLDRLGTAPFKHAVYGDPHAQTD